jgi:hypothetical protein
MSDAIKNDTESSIISEQYDDHMQLAEDTMKSDSKKACILLFVAAVVALGFDLIAIFSLHIPIALAWLNIAVVPVGLIALGLLAIKESMVAVVVAALLVFVFWIFNLFTLSPIVIVNGFIPKGIVIALLFGAYMFANFAMKEKRDLSMR